jgi:DNA-binding NtrC family response regulator
VPPLRERREDVPALAEHFLERLNRRYGTRRMFAHGMLTRLAELAWPGNVRELRHTVQRLYILGGDGPLQLPEPRPIERENDDERTVRFHVGMTFDQVECEMLLKTLAYCDYNKRQAARMLGVTAKTVYNRLERYRSLGAIPEEQWTALSD